MARTSEQQRLIDLRKKQALSMVGGDESKLSPGFLQEIETGDFSRTQKIADVAQQQKRLGQEVTGRGELQPEPQRVSKPRREPKRQTPQISEADRLRDIQRKQGIESLRAREAEALAGTEATRQEIAPAFQEARRGAITQQQQQARTFGEFLASRGLGGGAQAQGAEQQATIAQQVAGQEQLGALRQQEAGALSDIAQQEAAIRRETATDIGKLELGLQAGALEQQLAQQEQIRQEQVARANTLELRQLDQNNRIELANVNAQIDDAIRNNDFARTQQLTLLKDQLGRERDSINQKFDLEQLGIRGQQQLQQIGAQGAQQRATAEFKASLEPQGQAQPLPGQAVVPLSDAAIKDNITILTRDIPLVNDRFEPIPENERRKKAVIADFAVQQVTNGTMTDDQLLGVMADNNISLLEIQQAENRLQDFGGQLAR